MHGYIYKIENSVNGKLYVGKTQKTLEQRFREHLMEANRYKKDPDHFSYQSRLYPAMTKYGVHNFKISVIEQVDLDNICEREKYWISELHTVESGYNIAPGGLGGALFKGHKHSQHTKDLISLIHKGKTQDPAFVARRTASLGHHIQNLETGEIFKSIDLAQKKYGGTPWIAATSKGKSNGYHWIFLPKNDLVGLSEEERANLIRSYEADLHQRLREGRAKAQITRDNWPKERKLQLRQKASQNSQKHHQQMSVTEKQRLSASLKNAQNRHFEELLRRINKDEFIDLYVSQHKSREYMQQKYTITSWTLDRLIKTFNCSRKKSRCAGE